MSILYTTVLGTLVLGLRLLHPCESAYLLAQTPTARNTIHPLEAKEGGPSHHGAERTNAGGSRSMNLYRRHCIDCHDPDGRSSSAREIESRAPDFTDPEWHRAHGDFELAHAIWEGKKPMPAMKRELAMTDVDGLVLLVRGFRGGKLEIPEDSGARGEKDKPENASPVPRQPDLLPPQPAVGRSSGSPAANSDRTVEAIGLTARTTFQRLCAGCHGGSGDGSPLRASSPAIPDFTLRDWHEKRGDAALTVSILEGKGRAMPPFGTRLDATGAHDLVKYVRSFAGMRIEQGKELPNEFDLRFRQLMAEMEAIKRDYRALSHDDGFATSKPARAADSAAFAGSSP